MQTRWKTWNNSILYCDDAPTGTHAEIITAGPMFILKVCVKGVNETFSKNFKTLGAAKSFYTKNFGY